MSGGITTGLIIGGLAGVGGSVASAAIGGSAANKAASTQASAADQAAQLSYQASQNALQFQEQQYNTGQQELQPWLQSGTGALSNLDYLLGIGPQTSQQFSYGGGVGNSSLPSGLQTQTPGNSASIGQSGLVAGPTGTFSPAPAGGSLGGSPIGAPRPQPMAVGGSGQPSGALSGPQGTFNPQSGIATAPGASGQSGLVNGQQGTFTSGPVMGPTATLGGSDSPVQNPQANPTSGLATPPGYGGQSYSGTPQQGQLTSGSPASAGGFGSLMTPYSGTFQAPDALTEQNDPGYQARLNLGTQQLQQSAAARGSVLTGGTAKALDTYAQDYASNEYNNVYNRALNTFGTNYNVYNENQANQFNRLAAISGIGQTTAQQLGQLGQNASSQVSSNLLNTAQAMGQDYQNAGAANASGYVGSANAWANGLGGATSSLSNLALLQQLNGMNTISGPNEQPQGAYDPYGSGQWS